MNDRSAAKIVEITRASVVMEFGGRRYRIEGEGYSGTQRTVDYVLYSNSVTDLGGPASDILDGQSIVQAARDLLCARGWRVEVE